MKSESNLTGPGQGADLNILRCARTPDVSIGKRHVECHCVVVYIYVHSAAVGLQSSIGELVPRDEGSRFCSYHYEFDGIAVV